MAMNNTTITNKRKFMAGKNKQDLWMGLLFIAPAVIGFFIFRYVTSFQAFYYSFFRYDYVNPPGVFIGLDNYVNLFKSEIFWESLLNTIILFAMSVAFGFWVPIVQALMINELGKSQGVFRYLYLIPAGIPGVASMVVWKYMWNVDAGLANVITSALGLGEFDWLYDEKLVKFCLRIPAILGGGTNVLIYLVAIGGVGEEMYEAARLDGASRFRQIFSLTLPNIANIIGIQFLLSLTGSLLAFDDVYVMTKGGPGTSSTTVVMAIYQKAFNDLNYGQAMATSVVVLVITLGFVVLKMKLEKKED